LKMAEDKVIEDIGGQAEKRGQRMINAKIDQAKNELNQMKQEREQAVEAVQREARKNRSRAVAEIVALFKKTYLRGN